MEKKTFNSRAVIPLVTAVIAVIFIYVGLTQYGFWNSQPQPGFFPIIIAVALLATSTICLVQTLMDAKSGAVKYNKNELLVIVGGAGIIAGTFIIGLIASCLLYLFLWLRFVERAPWKHVLIIELVVGGIISVFVFWLQVQFPMGLFEFFLH